MSKFLNQNLRKACGMIHRFALRQINQNRGHIVAFMAEIDPGDNVGLVFLVGQSVRLIVLGVLRQGIDGSTANRLFADGIGMD